MGRKRTYGRREGFLIASTKFWNRPSGTAEYPNISLLGSLQGLQMLTGYLQRKSRRTSALCNLPVLLCRPSSRVIMGFPQCYWASWYVYWFFMAQTDHNCGVKYVLTRYSAFDDQPPQGSPSRRKASVASAAPTPGYFPSAPEYSPVSLPATPTVMILTSPSPSALPHSRTSSFAEAGGSTSPETRRFARTTLRQRGKLNHR